MSSEEIARPKASDGAAAGVRFRNSARVHVLYKLPEIPVEMALECG